jgi:hypothetical protein
MWALCQKNEGSVEIKQRWVVGLLTGHCHLKGHLFKMGLTDGPTCERCLEEDESATHIILLLLLVGWDLRHQVLRPLLAYCTEPHISYVIVRP